MLRTKHFLLYLYICLMLLVSALTYQGSISYAQDTSQPTVTADQTNAEKVKEFIDNGRRYYRQRNYEKAVEAWEQAIALDPQNIKVKKYIERAQAKLGKVPVKEKKTETPKITRTKETQVNELIDEGRTYYREGKYEEALAVWENAYKLDPENKRLGRYLIKVKEKVALKTKPAPAEGEPATQTPEESFEELSSKGKDFFREGDYAKAIEVWKKALALKPDNKILPKYIEKAEKNLVKTKPSEETPTAPATEAEQTTTTKTPSSQPSEDVVEEEIVVEEEKDIIRRDLAWCVNIAIQNHREAKIASEKIKKAEIDLFIARRNFFPNLSFIYSQAQGGSGTDFGTGITDTSTSSATRDFVRNRYKFQARHMVYSGGKARCEVQKAHIALDIEKKEYNRVVSQKALEVAKAYYEVARAEADLKIQNGLLKKTQDSLKLVEEQFKSGLVSELELLNMKAQINQIHSQVAASKQQLSHAVLELQHVMNIDITTPIRVHPLEDTEIKLDARYHDVPLIRNIQTYEPTQQAVDEQNQLRLDSYVIYALKNRADFAVEQLKLRKAEKEVDIAQTEFHPKFEVYGELGQGAEDSVQRTSELDLKTEYSTGVRLSWNFWGNTLAVNREERAEAPSVTKVGTERTREWKIAVGILDNLEPISSKQELVVKRMEALNDLANQKNTIIEEVRDAYHNFLKAKISKDTAKSKIEFRKKTVDLYNLQRSLGELETSKLAQAEFDLAAEMSGLHKALADYLTQLANLDAAIGKNIFYRTAEEQKAIMESLPEEETTAKTEDQPQVQPVTFKGVLYKLEKVTIGPATHKIVTGFKNRKWVALARSNSIDLNQYLGQQVSISGIPVQTEDWIDTVIVDNIEIIEKK